VPNDEKLQTINIGGVDLQVRQVEIVNRREQPNEYELEDGSVIRVANPSVVVYRIDAAADWEGHPGY
jgi:hypothetical protein